MFRKYRLLLAAIALSVGAIAYNLPARPQAQAFGNWVPTAVGSTSGNWTLSSASGVWSNISGLGVVRFSIATSAANSPVGNIQLGNIPIIFTQGGAANCFVTSQSGLTNSASYTNFTATIPTGGTVMNVNEIGSAQNVQLAAVARAAGIWSLAGTCIGVTQ